MNDEHFRFLTLSNQLPARLLSEQVAWVLGFQEYDVAILAAHKLLRPLGKPMANSVKHYATVEILNLAHDREWLSKATHVMSEHWRHKNARKGLAADERLSSREKS